MFDLENILVYANSNIQIIGIFIAIIGGLVASKLLNAKIERDTLEEKLNRIIKEIEFNTLKKSGKENRIYLKKKEDYMYYIHDKIIEEDFDISNYDDYDLTKEQRTVIIEEIKEIIRAALVIFKEPHTTSEVESVLKQNHIKENTIEYDIYYYVGSETGKSTSNSFEYPALLPNLQDVRLSSHFSSLQENLEERDLNNRIDELNELLKWKIIEKEDIESKIKAINSNLNIKKDVLLFIFITIFAIIIPQVILSIYPIFINFKWLKYVFAIYSINSFLISMCLMLWYIYKLFLNISKNNAK